MWNTTYQTAEILNTQRAAWLREKNDLIDMQSNREVKLYIIMNKHIHMNIVIIVIIFLLRLYVHTFIYHFL